LNNRVLNAKHFGDLSFHFCSKSELTVATL
jgi:hypothetical protein